MHDLISPLLNSDGGFFFEMRISYDQEGTFSQFETAQFLSRYRPFNRWFSQGQQLTRHDVTQLVFLDIDGRKSLEFLPMFKLTR